MSQSWIAFQDVSFRYETTTQPLIEHLTAHFVHGWTGVIGANGVGKTTILKLATGGLTPQRGHVAIPGRAVYCPQRTDDPPAGLEEFLGGNDAEACGLRGRLGVGADWFGRWDTLSHGERKRAQIAVALWLRPDVLALDEPTNHVDAGARVLLAEALRRYGGAGLLVSHDRTLLDTLCRQCLFVDPPDAVMRPGNYTEGSEESAREEKQRARERRQAKTTYARMRREVVRRRDEAARAHRKRSKRGLNPKDHDARAKKDLARVTGKDGQAGRLLNQLAGRLQHAEQRLRDTRVKKEYELGIWVPEARSHRDFLLRLNSTTLALGSERRLACPDLTMGPEDRIALTGPNGSGKSTLVAHVMAHLNVPANKVTYIPQEIDLHNSRDVMDRVRCLPKVRLARVMMIVSRLNSRPERLLESDAPSPGEIRKILLALGIAEGPHLIVMDEPTNHLDLLSVLCLEEALEGCPCGLLLVSHDERFLERLARTRWHIAPTAEGSELIIE